MDYALKERIGKPELFTGRKEELAYFLKWLDNIKEEKSQSTAMLARRKMGKTAIMERLFNITFFKNDNVIPFYYEVKETKMWVVDFCKDFFLTFIYHYIAFKSRNPEYFRPESRSDFGNWGNWGQARIPFGRINCCAGGDCNPGNPLIRQILVRILTVLFSTGQFHHLHHHKLFGYSSLGMLFLSCLTRMSLSIGPKIKGTGTSPTFDKWRK